MPQLNCFDNVLDLEIWGNFQVTSVRTIQIEVVKCSNKTTCKTDDEISNFMEEFGTMFMVYNDQVYQPDEYSNSVVTGHRLVDYITMKPDSKVIQMFNMQKTMLESEETYDGLGLFVRE